MTVTDWIGFAGVTILLIAYFLNITKKISSEGFPYLILNCIGAGVACFASVLLSYWPFIILEGAWTIVSLVSLLRYKKQSS